MGLRVYIRVDPYRDRRHQTQFAGDTVQHLQFGGGLQVETVDAQFQGADHFTGLFANPGKYNFCRIAAGSYHPLQLATGHDIKARAQPGQYIEHRQVGVGFHRITDQVLTTLQGMLILAKRQFQRRAGIDVTGRAVDRRNVAHRHVLGIQAAVPVGEIFHGRSR